jgi:hypothetical protein
MNLPRLDGLWKSSYSPPRPHRRVRMNLPCLDSLCGPNYSPSRRKRRVRMNLPCLDGLWSPSQFLPLSSARCLNESALPRQLARVQSEMSLPAINSHQCHVCMNPRQPAEVQLLSPSSSAPCPNESALPRRPMRSQLLSFSSQALCPHKSALPRRPVESQPVSPPCRQRGLAWIRHAQTACEGQTCLIIGVCPHESALPRRPVESKLAPFPCRQRCV